MEIIIAIVVIAGLTGLGIYKFKKINNNDCCK
jgi:hypothetical protein